MSDRAFPVICTRDVPRLVSFYEALGFDTTYGLPPEGDDPDGNPVAPAQRA